MKTLSEAEFLVWARGHGLEFDSRYPASKSLVFASSPLYLRYWPVPESMQPRSEFLGQLLSLLGKWESCFAWRHLGWWPDGEGLRPEWASDIIEHRLLSAVGAAFGTTDVLRYDAADYDQVLALMFITMEFGWSTGEDLVLVPDSAAQTLMLSHHDKAYVTFRDPSAVEAWDIAMGEHGFGPSIEVVRRDR
jgi:hypothetical protein